MPITGWRERVFAALVSVLAAGCASVPNPLPGDSGVELTGTAFFPQDRYQCGPAALATLLVASGIDTTPAHLVDQVYVPARKGSLQTEMLAAARSAGRLPYALTAGTEELVAELNAGRPVLVLQNLGVSWLPRWHYAVVIGYEPSSGTVILRSGTDERRVTPVNLFLRTWQRSQYWAFVVLKPGELPASPDPDRYFEAAAAFETVAATRDAVAAWNAALAEWPDRGLPAFAVGNLELAADRRETAARWYRRAIAIEPDYVMAYNNLAHALAGAGLRQAARKELLTAIEIAEDNPTARAVLVQSLGELEGH